MISKKTLRGGGLRILAILLATMTCLSLALMTTPHEANAADIPQCDNTGWKTLKVDDQYRSKVSLKRSGRTWNSEVFIGVVTTSIGEYVGMEISSTLGSLRNTVHSYAEYRISDTNLNAYAQVEYCTSSGDGLPIAKITYISNNVGKVFPTYYMKPVKEIGIHVTMDKPDGAASFAGVAFASGVDTEISDEKGYVAKHLNNAWLDSQGPTWAIYLNDSTGKLVGSFDVYNVAENERYLTLDANGGAWAGGAKTEEQIIDTNYKAVTDDRPTRDGYILDSWNTKADGTGDDVSNLRTGLKTDQTIYAIWKKDPGKPRNVQIDCSPREAGGVLCSVMAYYTGAPVQTRELNTTGTENLTWAGDPIAGVNLDRNGYAADMSCTTRGDGDSQCYYASLAEEPAQNNAYQAQMPTTGAPEGLSLIGLIALAVSVLGLAVVSLRRRD